MADCYRFNWAIRKLYKRLLQLGANEIYPTGEADQQHPEGLVILYTAQNFCTIEIDLYKQTRGNIPTMDDGFSEKFVG
jgi:hypothetical protein